MQEDRVTILGIPIDNFTLDETVEAVIKLTEAYANDRRSRYVCTVNTDFLVNAYGWSLSAPSHPKLLEVIKSADIVTADGMPVVWLSRWLNIPLKGRVTGADLVPKVIEVLAQKKGRVYFLGGEDAVARRASEVLMERYPGIRVVGIATPIIYTGEAPMDEQDKRIVQQINDATPDLLLIGLGNPKQELWFERVKEILQVPVSIGVGGVFNFLSGAAPRAPEWMQRCGLEWLHRLWTDPKRMWKRYLNDFVKFAFLSIPEVFRHQLNKLRG